MASEGEVRQETEVEGGESAGVADSTFLLFDAASLAIAAWFLLIDVLFFNLGMLTLLGAR